MGFNEDQNSNKQTLDAFYGKLQEMEFKFTKKIGGETSDLERDTSGGLQMKLDNSFQNMEAKINDVFLREAMSRVEQREKELEQRVFQVIDN